jgi:hypothetical protein
MKPDDQLGFATAGVARGRLLVRLSVLYYFPKCLAQQFNPRFLVVHRLKDEKLLRDIASDEAWDRAVVGSRTVGEVEHNLVDVAPAPAFGRIVALNDRVARGVEVRTCVPIWRIVAAANVTASSAESQVNPRGAGPQALLATEGARRHVANGAFMGALVGHQVLLRYRPRLSDVLSSQMGVERSHHLGALAYGGGDAFDRSRADIADREDAQPTCLKS